MRLRLFCFMLFAFAFLPAWAGGGLVLTPNAERIDLAPHVSLLRDEGGKIGVQEAATANGWQALSGAFNVGFTDAALWLRLDLERPAEAPTEWLLELNNAVLDDVRLYERVSDGSWREHRAGDDTPSRARDASYRNPLFHLHLDSVGKQALWLRVTARNSISAQLTLWQPRAFAAATRDESLAYGLLFGAYLTIIVLHFFFWFWTREALSGWYALYVANSFGQMAISFGYLQQYTGLSGRLGDLVLSLLICSSPWVSMKLFSGQLDLQAVMPRTARWFVRVTAAQSVITAILAVTVSYAAGVMPTQLVGLLEAIVLVGIALRLVWRRHPPALLFLVAYGPFLAGIGVRVLRNFTLLPPHFITDNGYQIGAITHMLVMGLLLMNRYNLLKAKMAQTQAEALRLKSERAEVLESEVAARTASLTAEISRREALESELRQALETEHLAQQEQRDFVAMVSHEFRTPLAIIDVSAQRIAADAQQAALNDRCKNVREAVRRMTRLMDEFLTLDRINGNLRTFAPGEADLRLLVAQAVSEWDRGSIEVVTAEVPATLWCDAQLLRIALRNLLANALRHSPEGVPVRLTVRVDVQGNVEFEVADCGNGIPEDEIPKLFQKYFRGRGAHDQPGAGLGLYLVDRIARLHGGSVSVISATGDCRFVLDVPRAGGTCDQSDVPALQKDRNSAAIPEGQTGTQ